MANSIYETGDNLQSLAIKAKDWFKMNNVAIPTTVRAWQASRIKNNEVPPGCTYGSLNRYGISVAELIGILTNTDKKSNNYDPINEDNIIELIGLKWLSFITVKGHKHVLTKCVSCAREESLDYGTLQRMRANGNKLCRYCRDAGGKSKEVSIYDKFEGFEISSSMVEDSRLKYKCLDCCSIIERTLTHVHTSEYLVCEICNPTKNFGARMYTELGYFDSKIEYKAYLILLNYFKPSDIIRQKRYNELFNTGTKHTADFYIKSIDLVLEVTSSHNNIGQKYHDVAAWKLSLSPNVKFAYSLKEVEDIVRPLAKVLGSTVEHSRSILRSSIIRGQKDARNLFNWRGFSQFMC